MNDYAEFLARKAVVDPTTGLSVVPPLNPMLFPFQSDIVTWALRRGRAAIWADCGLGKGPMQLEWAKHVPHDVLIAAPLGVTAQTVREGIKFGVPCAYARNQGQITERITVTNYEMLEHFDLSQFGGVVLDESSILKSFDGKTRTEIIESFAQTPFRLACSATPAPNDYMELGNHSQFLGVMSYTEMLSMYFVHDGGETQKWRLKGHAEADFWKWLCSWAVMIRKPSDLGYDDTDFILPELILHDVTVKVDKPTDGFLFAIEAQTLQERLRARRDTIDERVALCYKLTNANERENPGIQPEILLGERGARESASDSLVEEKQGAHRQSSEEGIPEGVLLSAPGEIQTHTSAAEEIQRNKKASIRHRSGRQREIEKGGKGLARQEPAETASAAVTKIRDNHRADDSDDGATEPRMRDLRGDGSEQEEAFPCGGSLPRYREVQRDTLRSMQQGDRTPDGQPEASKVGSYLPRDQWIVWCNLNAEANKAARLIPGSVNIQGSDSREKKEQAIIDFLDGRIRVLISKSSIFGLGLNLQCCSQVIFLGLSDSYESYYQSLRRVYRFGQKQAVNAYIICAETEGAVVSNIKRKEREALSMAENMVEHMQELNKAALQGATVRSKNEYVRDIQDGPDWTLHLADCVDVAREQADESIDFSIYSPPFASLYTYSNSDRDMGNCASDAEFMEQYIFLIREKYRITKPGRQTSFHCMTMPMMKSRDGVIGLKDLRGKLIAAHEAEGWIYHAEACIWKDPVTQMQRTKSLGLLHKQIKKDSCMSRMGTPDYLVTMRKPGENLQRVEHTNETFPVDDWQKIASPVWMDINPSDTLQFRSAREHNDERHICPLQLEVIRRAMRLWSNPGDMVFSPFAGIGSEGFVALQMGRRFLGAELKRSYYEQAGRNLGQAKAEQGGLFA